MSSPMYPLIQNPERFTWDFWYYFDPEEMIFRLLYLNADRSLVPDNKHHFSARIGYALTEDFTDIEWVDDDVFHADKDRWDNTSIWSGDVIRISDGFLFYYTSRNKSVDDGLTQNVGLARSKDMIHWKRIEGFQLKPDGIYYETRSIPGDTSIHAWRDPFVFLDAGRMYMLLSAKTTDYEPGYKGAVALLRSRDNSFTDWEILPPVFAPGWYSECEVPQLYSKSNTYVLVYSSWGRHDHRPTGNNEGGLHAVPGLDIEGSFQHSPGVLLPESSGLYAARVIPELNGDIVGFNIKYGGLKRVSASTGLQTVQRDFTDFSL